jgi:hypothetical protein
MNLLIYCVDPDARPKTKDISFNYLARITIN